MKSLKRIMVGLTSCNVMAGSISIQAKTDISPLPLINPRVTEQSVNDVSQVIQNITDKIEESESIIISADTGEKQAAYDQALANYILATSNND